MNSYDKVLNDMSAKELNELKEAFTEMNGSGVDMNDPNDRAALVKFLNVTNEESELRKQDFANDVPEFKNTLQRKIDELYSKITEISKMISNMPEFAPPENYLKNAEMEIEDDYNSIDGVINNGRRDENKAVNFEYYKSLSPDDRYIITESKQTAQAVIDTLEKNKIPYSAVERKNDRMAVTVSGDNKELLDNTLKNVRRALRREIVNPDFYRSLEKGERYTQRMSEEQAKSVVKALQKQGIEHSAVIGGKRSGVTVRQSDYPKAEKFFMTNDKLRKSAASIRSSKAEKDKDRSAERAAKGGISLE